MHQFPFPGRVLPQYLCVTVVGTHLLFKEGFPLNAELVSLTRPVNQQDPEILSLRSLLVLGLKHALPRSAQTRELVQRVFYGLSFPSALTLSS